MLKNEQETGDRGVLSRIADHCQAIYLLLKYEGKHTPRELRAKTGRPERTVFRILSELEVGGFAVKVDFGVYVAVEDVLESATGGTVPWYRQRASTRLTKSTKPDRLVNGCLPRKMVGEQIKRSSGEPSLPSDIPPKSGSAFGERSKQVERPSSLVTAMESP